jgi:hypothetical protein
MATSFNKNLEERLYRLRALAEYPSEVRRQVEYLLTNYPLDSREHAEIINVALDILPAMVLSNRKLVWPVNGNVNSLLLSITEKTGVDDSVLSDLAGKTSDGTIVALSKRGGCHNEVSVAVMKPSGVPIFSVGCFNIDRKIASQILKRNETPHKGHTKKHYSDFVLSALETFCKEAHPSLAAVAHKRIVDAQYPSLLNNNTRVAAV